MRTTRALQEMTKIVPPVVCDTDSKDRNDPLSSEPAGDPLLVRDRDREP
ncbi:MAG: hypothetical protein ABI551_09300 [Polyangiaceae bacterium]